MPEVKAVVAEVIASGWYIHGPHHAAFETQLAAYTATHHAVSVANVTDALAIALLAATASRAGLGVLPRASRLNPR